jgi:Icc-related predicted phosphoesterase
MSVKVLHSSDLHGGYKTLLVSHANTDFDIWIDTGDFFPNGARPFSGRPVEGKSEVSYQTRWLQYGSVHHRITAWLRGRPALIMPGNHDFISLAEALRKAGADARPITPSGVECLGLRWAGFREIPWIHGAWVGETFDFTQVINDTWATAPDVLVTHGPPAGILDEEAGYGNPALTSALTHRPHRIQAHFFGHTHVNGGQTAHELGVLFVNGACTAKVHTLDKR